MEPKTSLALPTSSAREFSIFRGNAAEFNELMLLRSQFLIKDKKYKELEDFLNSIRLSFNFSGTWYFVKFSPSKDVTITKLGFWGPVRPECSEDYGVKLEVFVQENYACDGSLVTSETTSIVAEGQKTFDLVLQKPVRVSASHWCRIKFQLNGPSTVICGALESNYKEKESGVSFEFAPGSNQLPKLYFTL